jgi:ribulose-phosphate 3-epimerase
VLLPSSELRAGGPELSVGLLTADLARLDDEVSRVRQAGVRLLHFDVIDGHYARGLTFGAPVVAAVADEGAVKDVHLMVRDPLAELDAYLDAGAGIVTFHAEAAAHPHRVLQELAGTGVVRGVALSPSVSVSAIEPLLGELDYVLVLAINPGFGGQRFSPATGARVVAVRELAERAGVSVAVGVDGGVKADNAPAVAAIAPDVVVAGSVVFDGGDAGANAAALMDLIS